MSLKNSFGNENGHLSFCSSIRYPFRAGVEWQIGHHDDIRREVLNDCRSQSRIVGKPNGVLVTGDVAFSGKLEQYSRAGEWLDSLTKEVDCPLTSVSVVPGNHDVDRTRINKVAKMVHQQLRSGQPRELDGDLEGIASGDEEGNPLLPKLAAYRESANRYDCNFVSPREPFWHKDYHFGENILRFIGFNSVQISDEHDALGNMILGNYQYVIPREENIEYVVMMHHPIYWFKDRVDIEQFLARARVLMFGHEHQLELRKIIDNDAEHLEIYAGATNPKKVEEFFQYRYNWIEFELHSENGQHNLIIRIYPRVWEPSHTSFVADRVRLGGDIPKEFSIACASFIRQESLLRKIYKRIMRRWNGERYIQAILEDLARRDDPLATQKLSFLKDLSKNPDFYEPWD